MAIVYPITLPTSPAPRKSKISQLVAVAVTQSPFTFEEQAFLHQGAAWQLALEYPPMRRATAEYLIAAFMKLKGPYGTFLAGDYDGRNPRGAPGGSVVVSGAGQLGDTLTVRGFAHFQTGALLTGDYLQLGSGAASRLYKCLDDVASDSSGGATFTIWPPLRGSPGDGDVVSFVNTMTRFRLLTPFEWDADEVSTYGVSITAVERP